MSLLAHVSSFPPTQCGVAEYAAALARAVKSARPGLSMLSVRLDYDTRGVSCFADRIALDPADASAVRLAAEEVNEREPKVILLQHEFKLFGGADGEHLLAFLATVVAPVVTTL